PALVVDDSGPARSDQRDDGGTGIESAFEGAREVFARFEGIDIAEHPARAENLRQVVGQPSRGDVAVGAAIADEDSTHGDGSRWQTSARPAVAQEVPERDERGAEAHTGG